MTILSAKERDRFVAYLLELATSDREIMEQLSLLDGEQVSLFSGAITRAVRDDFGRRAAAFEAVAHYLREVETDEVTG